MATSKFLRFFALAALALAGVGTAAEKSGVNDASSELLLPSDVASTGDPSAPASGGLPNAVLAPLYTEQLVAVKPRPQDTKARDWTDEVKDALVVYDD